MIRLLAVAGLAFATLACGSTLREADSQAGGAGAAAATSSPAPTAGRPVGAPAPDWVRVTDELGGWSIDAPKAWFVQPISLFGDSGSGITSYDPATSSIPIKTGMNVRVQLMWDRNGDTTDLRTFAERRIWIATCVACRKVLETRHFPLAGQDADFYVVEQNQPQPFDELEPRLFWLLRSPYFADRILVIQAVPGASHFRATVEQMVSTLQLFKPGPPALTPTKTRQQITDEFRARDETVTRVETKLMRWQEWEMAYNAVLRARSAVSGGPSAAYGGNDPDVLVWVVAVTGTFYELKVGPPPGPGSIGPPGANVAPAPTPREQHWRITVVPAREPYNWGGPSESGPQSTWPTWFDQLVDRDR
jgi:hypothetical protein